MFSTVARSVLGFFMLVGVVLPVGAESPNLGLPLTPQQVKQINLTVMPDGQGLPPGSGSAKSGAELYKKLCLACHGTAGEQGINDRLAGGHDTIASAAPVRTIGSYWPYATTVFDYLRRAMPYTAPGSLKADEIYALTAYLLFINGLVSENMLVDASSLPEVSMPNVGNFIWAVPGE